MPPSRVPDGRIVQSPKLDKFGNTFTRMFGYVGNAAMLIHEFTPAYMLSEASAEPVLRAQASRLSAGWLFARLADVLVEPRGQRRGGRKEVGDPLPGGRRPEPRLHGPLMPRQQPLAAQ